MYKQEKARREALEKELERERQNWRDERDELMRKNRRNEERYYQNIYIHITVF